MQTFLFVESVPRVVGLLLSDVTVFGSAFTLVDLLECLINEVVAKEGESRGYVNFDWFRKQPFRHPKAEPSEVATRGFVHFNCFLLFLQQMLMGDACRFFVILGFFLLQESALSSIFWERFFVATHRPP